jgi:hypothetical protein
MKNIDYIPFYEYSKIISDNISFYLEKYKFTFGKKKNSEFN